MRISPTIITAPLSSVAPNNLATAQSTATPVTAQAPDITVDRERILARLLGSTPPVEKNAGASVGSDEATTQAFATLAATMGERTNGAVAQSFSRPSLEAAADTLVASVRSGQVLVPTSSPSPGSVVTSAAAQNDVALAATTLQSVESAVGKYNQVVAQMASDQQQMQANFEAQQSVTDPNALASLQAQMASLSADYNGLSTQRDRLGEGIEAGTTWLMGQPTTSATDKATLSSIRDTNRAQQRSFLQTELSQDKQDQQALTIMANLAPPPIPASVTERLQQLAARIAYLPQEIAKFPPPVGPVAKPVDSGSFTSNDRMHRLGQPS